MQADPDCWCPLKLRQYATVSSTTEIVQQAISPLKLFMQQCCMTYNTTKMTCFNANTIINRVWFGRLKFEAFFSEKCQENPYFRPEILNSTTNSD